MGKLSTQQDEFKAEHPDNTEQNIRLSYSPHPRSSVTLGDYDGATEELGTESEVGDNWSFRLRVSSTQKTPSESGTES